MVQKKIWRSKTIICFVRKHWPFLLWRVWEGRNLENTYLTFNINWWMPRIAFISSFWISSRLLQGNCDLYLESTLPETNIEFIPENRPSKKELHLPFASLFRAEFAIRFREGISRFFQIWKNSDSLWGGPPTTVRIVIRGLYKVAENISKR